MADPGVVDQLIVELTLDDAAYRAKAKKLGQLINGTEKKLDENEKKSKKRDTESKKRTQESTKAVKQLTEGLGKLAFTVGAVLGIGGGAAGILGAIVALTGMETGLRRMSVSTGLSTRELQGWGSAARRLGADAQSGQAAIAALAREQQQFALTGSAPTMAAFSRLGVNVGPNTPIQDILAQAQQIYRQASPAQQKQDEASLSSAGVSDDIIVMLRSEKDIRDEYNRSYAESATENRKALDAVTDALAGLQSTAVNMANALATLLQPAVEQFARWASQGAQNMSAFVDKVIAAGGGVDGFMDVLRQDSPQLATLLQEVGTGLNVLGQAVDVVVYGFKELGRAGAALFDWIDNNLRIMGIGSGPHPLTNAVGTVGAAIKWAWTDMVADARADGGPVGTLTDDTSRVALSASSRARLGAGSASASAIKLSGSTQDQASQLMSQLVSQYGMSPDQAAAITANAFRESTLGKNQFNPAGGGQGARGLLQWRGSRITAFRNMFGVDPQYATPDQQIQFMLNDPYERGLLNKSFAGGGDAATLGARFSNIYEGVGNSAEDRTRGALAAQFAGLAPTGGGDPSLSPGEQILITGPVTVHANSPAELVDGITRVSGVQSYNSAIR